MNKYQWLAFTSGFFLLGTVFATWTALTGFGQPDTVIWAIGRIYSIVTWVAYGLAGICFFCGLLEGYAKGKR